jgi:hypothetical protein
MNKKTCQNCSGTRVYKIPATINRSTGQPVSMLSLLGGIAFAALGVGLLWGGITLLFDPVIRELSSRSSLYFLAFAFLTLPGGIRMISGYVKADKVKQSTYVCKDCGHKWYEWEDKAGINANEVHQWRIEALKNGDLNDRKRAIEELGVDRDTKAVEPLIDILQESDIQSKLDVAEALGKIGDNAAVEPLKSEMTDNKNILVKLAAVKALGELGSAEAKEAINEALESEHKDVIKAAQLALENMRQ